MSALILEAIEGVAACCPEASSPFAGGDEIKTARNPLPDCYSIVIELTRKVYEPAILAWFASPSSNHVDPRHCGSKEPRVESCSE
jgi:hypothetical protein